MISHRQPFASLLHQEVVDATAFPLVALLTVCRRWTFDDVEGGFPSPHCLPLPTVDNWCYYPAEVIRLWEAARALSHREHEKERATTPLFVPSAVSIVLLTCSR